MNRRTLLRATALVPIAAALSACSLTSSGGVTTVTLNVADIDAWGQAAINAVTLITGAPGMSTLLGPEALPISVATGLVAADLKAFDAAANGSVTVTFNGSSAGAAVTSLNTDAQTLFAIFQKAIGNSLGTLDAAIATYFNAFQTVVSLIQAAVDSAQGNASAVVTKMTETDALKALNVTKHAAGK